VALISLGDLTTAAATTPSDAKTLTSGNSPFSQQATPVAGSDSYLVSTMQPYWWGGAYGTVKVMVRNAQGSVVQLQVPSATPINLYTLWSMVGSRLVIVSQSKVAWWDFAAGTSGVTAWPTGGVDFYGASPDGWLYTTDGTEILDQPSDGSSAYSLGSPFSGNAHPDINLVTVGDSGLVAVNSAGDALVGRAWNAGGFTALPFDTSSYVLDGCDAVVDGVAGCAAHAISGTNSFVLRVPTDGSAGAVYPLGQAVPVRIGVTAAQTLWLADDGHLDSVPAGGSAVTRSTYADPQDFPNLVSALGQVAFTGGSLAHQVLVETTDAAAAPTTLVTPGVSPVHVLQLELTGGRVVFTDNKKDFNAGDLWARSVRGTSSLSIGQPSLLSHGAAEISGLSVAGSVTVTTNPTSSGAGQTHIRWPGHSKTIAADLGIASGGRVLYVTHSRVSYVFDTSTRHVTKIGALGAVAYDFAGSYIAYAKKDGTVWRRRIGSSKAVKLRGATSGVQFIDVVASGDYVGWIVQRTTGNSSGYRNARTMAKAITLPSAYTLQRLTTNGALVTRSASLLTTNWYVRPYHSTSYVKVLSQTYSLDELSDLFYVSSVEPLRSQATVDSGRIAWIDHLGVGHIAPLPSKLR
jgi:hypothetical protein